MKNLQKGFAVQIIIMLVALLVVGGGVYIYKSNKVETPVSIPDIIDKVPATTTDNIVGGDRDTHGCIGSAGYTWCEVKNKCLRIWEEKCEVVSTSTEPVFCTMDAMQCPDGTWVGRTGPKCEFVCPNNNTQTIQKVSVKSFYTKPQISNDKEIINLIGNQRNGEYVVINITGTINNFEFFEVEYDMNSQKLIETKIINKISSVTNKYILINTVLPEGIPFEKISWESVSGRKYELILSEGGIDAGINQEFILE
jgi:hypothetical protein